MPPRELHFDFPHEWTATILPAPPMISPSRTYMYPRSIAGEEEALSRGAMLLDVRREGARNFLGICALGFEGEEPLSGVWSCPNPREICAVAGGYAYLIDAFRPEHCTHLDLRPVIEVVVVAAQQLLLFVGFHAIAAWGVDGFAWETSRITWEGLRIAGLEDGKLSGFAWDMPNDCEVPFEVELVTGKVRGGAAPG